MAKECFWQIRDSNEEPPKEEKPKGKRRRIRSWFANRSIFFKLSLVVFALAFMIDMSVPILFKAVEPQRESVRRLVRACTELLVNEIGEDPNEEKARAIGQAFGFDLRFEGPHRNFSTDPSMAKRSEIHVFGPSGHWKAKHSMFGRPDRQKVDEHRAAFRRNPPPYLFGVHEGRHYAIIDRPQGTFTIAPSDRLEHPFFWAWGLALLLFFSLTLWTGLRMMKRMLSPLKGLQEGVDQIAEGNFDHRVNVKNKDELGRLSGAFNEMVSNVQTQMKSKEELLYSVSHELRSPLARMRMMLEFMDEGKTREDLKSELDRMEGMIAELLESARLKSAHGKLKTEPVDLAHIIKQITEPKQFERVQLEFTEEQFIIPADQPRLVSLATNLIENALKYSDEQVVVRLRKDKDFVVLEVMDKGDGIPEEEMPQLFEPFFRVDKSRDTRTGGFGLGLSLCREIARAHGGDLTCESVLGEGTAFKATLPLK